MPLLLLTISRWIAFALLSLSLLLPWFRVPFSVREDINGAYSAVCCEPASTIVFKVFLFAVLSSAFGIGYLRRHSGSFGWSTLMAVSGYVFLLALSIAYPALTIQRCAQISVHAAWLQVQHASFIATAGDTFTAPEYVSQPGELEVDVKEILPRAFEAIPTPGVVSFSDLRVNKLKEILMWLGVSPAFCQFVYGGWFCGIFGSFLLAISFLRIKAVEDTRENLGLARTILPLFGFGGFLLCCVCLI